MLVFAILLGFIGNSQNTVSVLSSNESHQNQPNIIKILADDAGYIDFSRAGRVMNLKVDAGFHS